MPRRISSRVSARESRLGAAATAAALFVLACAASSGAQERPRHGKLFAPVDLGLLEGPDRDLWQMPDRIMDA
ncbi:MAG TPA: hypothetical protein PKZ08_16865, partial [Vicinamibacterales bacterium]|nr:hypothetical protein [Vicinamibacterales bacterium]